MSDTPIYDALRTPDEAPTTDESFFAVQRDLGEPMSIPDLRRELEVCAWYSDGTRRGELIPLAAATRHRIVRALMQADATIDALQRIEPGYLPGIAAIMAERTRQIDGEHHEPGSDVGRAHELVEAAVSYAEIAVQGADASHDRYGTWTPPGGWPWHESTWKPTDDPIQDLTKAGALIAAAIDSLRVPLAGRTRAQRRDEHIVRRIST